MTQTLIKEKVIKNTIPCILNELIAQNDDRNTLNIELKLDQKINDEDFFELCQTYSFFKLERNARGDLILMSPAGGETSEINAGITAQVWQWNNQTKFGKAFDSSGGFKLANGATLSPDAAWMTLVKWESLTKDEKRKFPPICPDFVVELMSPSDSLKKLQEKMREYIENGVQLGWLINPDNRTVEIYRPGAEVEILQNPTSLSGEPILPGFVLNLDRIW